VPSHAAELTHVTTALICGISGQDGAYLAQLLVEKGYDVIGTSRDAQVSTFANLDRLKVRERVRTVSMSPTDFRSVIQTFLKFEPDEIYSLGGQSSVGLSFDQPVETLESHAFGTLNMLEAIRMRGKPVRFYNAGSGECFGETTAGAATETTPFRPRSPYGVAKAASYWAVANYRESYGLFACSGLLFNHESPLRAPRFVTRKVVAAAHRIANGSNEKLRLGNLHIRRDWGWAPEYVHAMWKMLQGSEAEDYVIATGESHSLEEFVQEAFTSVGLDWKKYVETDPSLLRPADIFESYGNPTLASERLGWSATMKMPQVIRAMVAAESEAERH
jgi:GDPmannose 4,6-dehydratase